MRRRLVAAVAVVSIALLTTGAVQAQEKPRRVFSLSARLGVLLEGNRVECGMVATGELCTNHTGSSVFTRNAWPAGTSNAYIFSSGAVIAGIIGADGGPWAGDTTGGFFFDTKGTTVHGSPVGAGIVDSRDPDDLAAWPGSARVPAAGGQAGFFHSSLRGRVAASDQDLWWLVRETDPALGAGRPHPLGVVLEVRAMAFAGPAGVDDVVFLLYTLHNVSSLDPTDYAGAGPDLQPLLLAEAELFHQRVEAELGVTLPAGGYTIRRLHAGTSTDADVADAGGNYEGINPASRYTYAYQHSFDREYPAATLGWTFDPGLFEAPFFEGPGSVAVAPLGGSPGVTEFHVATNLAGGGEFGAPANTTQLYRYLSGHFSVASGDAPCSFDPATTRVCFLVNSEETDIRGMVSSALPDLAPGGSATLAVAYVFAPPVAVPGFVPGPGVDVKPGVPVQPGVAGLAAGVPLSDSIAGYAGFEDVNGDGEVAPEEFIAVPGSLKHKSQLARAFFQAGFLRPAAPEAPEFFLVPGDGQVTVVWRPSATEETGDPYADLAEAPRNADGTINQLYDPNFRRLDVEGYRVWRGRTDRPGEMELVAQFDHVGTTYRDHDGLVRSFTNFGMSFALCAPELGVMDDCTITFDPVVPGQARTAGVDHGLVGPLSQVRVDGQRPQRFRLASGSVLVTRADTVVTGGGSGFPELADTGVPFLFTDSSVSNGFRYWYAVTAFDVNSIRSGPSSLDSPRAPRSATPRADAVNRELAGAVGEPELRGRSGVLDPDASVPALDPATGNFSGPMPPTGEAELLLPGFDPALFTTGGEVTARLDSVALGSSYGGVPIVYWYTVTARGEQTAIGVPALQDQTNRSRVGEGGEPALPVDEDAVASHGGSADYRLPVLIRQGLTGVYYAGGYGRGCLNSASGFAAAGGGNCAYNGSRWFDGPSPARNETVPHPQRGNIEVFTGTPMTDFNNGGALTGVRTIFQAQAYISASTVYRQVEGVLAGARRSADYNVHWGPGGRVDSVVDVTYDVPVPFDAGRLGATWGILNADAAQPSGLDVSYDQRAELTPTDFACVEPLRSDASAAFHMPCGTGPGTGPAYLLSETAVPGAVAAFSGMNTANARTAPALPQVGFAMYLVGNIFLFELEGGQLPAAGTVWTLRDYVGAISGGGCATCGDGDYGDYTYTHSHSQPLTAVGVELKITYEVTNTIRPANNADLAHAHPVPDPYYALGSVGLPEEQAGVAFVNLPADAIVRIYSLSGRLVRVLEHDTDSDGTARWDVRNRAGDPVASGVYFYHIEAGEARRTGRMTIVNSVTPGGQ